MANLLILHSATSGLTSAARYRKLLEAPLAEKRGKLGK